MGPSHGCARLSSHIKRGNSTAKLFHTRAVCVAAGPDPRGWAALCAWLPGRRPARHPCLPLVWRVRNVRGHAANRTRLPTVHPKQLPEHEQVLGLLRSPNARDHRTVIVLPGMMSLGSNHPVILACIRIASDSDALCMRGGPGG